MAQASLLHEKDKNFFAVMKSISPDKFNFINSLDPEDLANAYSLYISKMVEVKAEVCKAYFILEENRLIFKFGRELCEEGLSISPNGFGSSAPSVLFNSIEGFSSYKTYLRYIDVLSSIKIFIKKQGIKEKDYS